MKDPALEKEASLTMAEAIEAGHVEVWLEGEKLQGGYALGTDADGWAGEGAVAVYQDEG